MFICMYGMGPAGFSEATVFRGFQIPAKFIFENPSGFSLEANRDEKVIPLRDIQRNPEVLREIQRFSEKPRGFQRSPEVSRGLQRFSEYYFQMFRGFQRDSEELLF